MADQTLIGIAVVVVALRGVLPTAFVLSILLLIALEAPAIAIGRFLLIIIVIIIIVVVITVHATTTTSIVVR